MSDTIKEVTDFSADVTLRSLISAEGNWKVDSITVVDAGSGGLALQGTFEATLLTDVQDGDAVSLSSISKILATGTSVAKVRVAFSRIR